MSPTEETPDTEHPDQTREVAPVSEVEDTRPLPRIEPVVPAAPGGVVVRRGENAVVDAEVLSAAESAALERRRGVIAVTGRLLPAPVARQRVGAAGRAGVRHARHIRVGAGQAVGRWRDAHGSARFERQMRAAEAAGDHERLADWHTRAEQAKRERHARRQARAEAPLRLAKAVAGAFAAVLVGLTVLGLVLAAAHRDITAFTDPFTGVLGVVRALSVVVSLLWVPVLLVAPVAGVGWLWWQGRAADPAPAGTPGLPGPSGGPGREVVPDESAILGALRNLNLSPLNRKIKEGWMPRWVQPTMQDGKGWRTQLELPPGVTVEMINNCKDVLAHNLVRLPVEVWPTEPKNQPGVLDLWVAHPGLLTGPVAAYPLLHEGGADYFAGVPVGVDQRGTEVIGKLMACNYAIAGIMGSGKTSLVINLLCGAMLDPLVDIDVYVMAENVDYDPLRPRLRTLVKGDEEVTVPAVIEAVRELRSMLSERGRILSELGGEDPKLTRGIATADPRMRPRVVVIDECQELFMHEQHGEEAKQLAIKVMMKARKVGITLIWVTPAPSADSLPRTLAKTVSHRVCFAIGDHQGNDAILGTGAHKRGITAVDLVAGEDIGTAMASGFAPRPGLLRTHHIRKEKGTDEITPIVQRALAAREDAGISSDPAPVITAAEVDPLADIAAVLGEAPRLRTHEVLHGLAERNPTAYRGWGFTDLTGYLKPWGAEPRKYGGNKVIRTDLIHTAITDRDQASGNGAVDDDPDSWGDS